MAEKKSNQEVIVFQSSDGQAHLEVTTDYDTVWLSQQQISQLFDKDVRTVNEHVINIYKEGELEEGATIRNFRIVQLEGKREVEREIKHYNLDVIISLGYRVKSKRGVEFRQWATRILKQYLIEGYAINETRLENAPGTLLELFKMQVQLWEEQQLTNTEIRDDIINIGEKIQAIEAKIKSVDDGYYTIAGWCSLNKIPCPLPKAKAWGKSAVKLSHQRDIPMGTAHDERFGRVRTYHKDILKAIIK